MGWFDNHRSGQSNAGQQNAQDQYARLDFSVLARRGEKLSAVLTLSSQFQFGGNNGDNSPGNLTNSGSATAVSKSSVHNVPSIAEAYGIFKFTNTSKVYGGRKVLNVGEGAFVGGLNRNFGIQSFDGFMLAMDPEFGLFNVGLFKVNELSVLGGTGNPSSDPEHKLYLIYFTPRDLPNAIKKFQFFVGQNQKDETTGSVSTIDGTIQAGSQSMQELGAYFASDFSIFHFDSVYIYQVGTYNSTAAGDTKITAYALDIGLGLEENWSAPVLFGLRVHYDSGDDPGTGDKNETYQSPYYDHSAYGAPMDVIRWGNLRSYQAYLGWMPSDTSRWKLVYTKFMKTQPSTGLNFGWRYTGTALLSSVTMAADSDIGSETDLVYENKVANGGKVGARLGVFTPGSTFTSGTPSASANIYQAYIFGQIDF